MKTLKVLGLFTALSVAAAQGNPALAISSAETLEGALESSFDAVVTQYVPGYGLQLNARWLGDFNEEAYLTTVTGVLTGLSPLVKGLAAEDVVSVSYSLSGFSSEPTTYYTIRVSPDQPNEIEVFINGSAR